MNKWPPLKTLPAFLAVAKNLSFSKAAEELHVTHSAISQSVRLLESFIGHKLFDRQGKKVSVTPRGNQYYHAINAAMDIIDEATQQQLGSAIGNLLTVNVVSTLALRWLIARLPAFQSLHPDIDLRLSTLTSKEFDFDRHAIDIAIAYGHEDDWPQFETKKIFDDKLVLVGNSKQFKKILPIEKLLKEYKAIYVEAKLRKFDWENWCKAACVSDPKNKNRIYFESSSQALQAVISGVGIMVTHYPFIMDDIYSERLILLSKIELPLRKGYYLVYPKEKARSKKISHFCHWICSESNEQQQT